MPIKPGKTGCDNFCGGILANLPAGSLQLWQQPFDFQKEGVIPFHSSFLLAWFINKACCFGLFPDSKRGRGSFVAVQLFHAVAWAWSFDTHRMAALWIQGATDGLPWCNIAAPKGSVWSLALNDSRECHKGTICRDTKLGHIVLFASRLGPWSGLQFSQKWFFHSKHWIVLRDYWVLLLNRPIFRWNGSFLWLHRAILFAFRCWLW